MTELDRETQAAIDALVHRLRNREPGTDDEPFAMEFVQALIGRGWRPTNAVRQALWQNSPGYAPADGAAAAAKARELYPNLRSRPPESAA